MVCGTASDVGKSQVVTGLCRLLARGGVAVAPFKGQNMALNSWVTAAGDEIGRSQAVQAVAAGVAPEATMNPVLLKPTGERTSQVIVMGQPIGDEDALGFQTTKRSLQPTVLAALAELRARFDVVLLEGAGSPAEPNLMDDDLVNLGLADTAGIPAVLVCDIDRGGAFAALAGTMSLLPTSRRERVGGFMINKFRGDPTILRPAIEDAELRNGIPCLGVLPYVEPFTIDAEDSLALGRGRPAEPPVKDGLDIAVCRFPHISNFTDVDALSIEPGIGIRFVGHASALGDPDLVILPGSKCTVDDLAWLHATGLVTAIEGARDRGTSVLGLCAGFQMLGRRIVDEVESRAGVVEALGWLPMVTTFDVAKITRQRKGTMEQLEVHGYEIHHGRPQLEDTASGWFELATTGGAESEGFADVDAGLWGSSLHGLFEADSFRGWFLRTVASRRAKEFQPGPLSFEDARGEQIDRMADLLERELKLDELYGLIEMAT
jgi:adenosylcobyric acid synthase